MYKNMKPIFFTIDNSLHLKAIPDTQYHLDGHAVITYNYNIFLDATKDDPASIITSVEPADKITDPNYYGFITFEKPGQLFSYTPGEQRHLTRSELEEVIEHLTHFRDHPGLWNPN